MFGKKNVFSGGEYVDTIIGRETKIKGLLQTSGTLRIDGYIEGEIITQGDVVIGEGGIVKAVINARNCIVAGEIYGDIIAEQKLEIAASGKVIGNIKSENLQIGEGATFCGLCEMRRDEITEAAADLELG